MALRSSPWVPSTILRGKAFQTCKLDKPSQNPLPVCSLYLSISPLSNITINNSRRITSKNPFVLQISSSSQPESSSTTATAETLITGSETEPRTRLIAQNVPWNCTIDDVRNLFEKHGTVVDIELSMYNKTRNRGLAFVTMGSEEEALVALNNLQSYEYEGRTINVEFSTSKKKKKPPPVETVPTTFKVFVANLSWKVTSADLKEFFSSMSSNVVGAEVIYQQPDEQTEIRRSSGYGFVSFSSKEEADAAITTFKGKVLMGRPMRLGRSRRKLKEGLKQEFRKPTQVEETSTEDKSVALSENAV